MKKNITILYVEDNDFIREEAIEYLSLLYTNILEGISSKILNRIYEPYFTTKEGNSGIGLYMSKMIIEKNMGGELRVSNTLEGAVSKIIF